MAKADANFRIAIGEPISRPIKLSDGGRAKAWLEDELLLWQRQRLASRDTAWKDANRE